VIYLKTQQKYSPVEVI